MLPALEIPRGLLRIVLSKGCLLRLRQQARRGPCNMELLLLLLLLLEHLVLLQERQSCSCMTRRLRPALFQSTAAALLCQCHSQPLVYLLNSQSMTTCECNRTI